MAMDADERLAKLLERDPAAREEWARDKIAQRSPHHALGPFSAPQQHR
jgi:hypothetical protein